MSPAWAELAAILSSIPDALAVIDRSWAFVRKNLAYDALLVTVGGESIPRDESGQPLSVDATPQMRSARGECFSLVFTLRITDGSPRWFQAVGLPTRANHLSGGLLMIRDITELEHHSFPEGVRSTRP